MPLEPTAKGRARIGKFGAFTPKKTRSAEAEVKYFLHQLSPYKCTGPVILRVEFGIVRPKSVKEHKRPLPTCKPDLDNMVKLVTDSANTILWDDDSQITSIDARKVYADHPYIMIEVGEILHEIL